MLWGILGMYRYPPIAIIKNEKLESETKARADAEFWRHSMTERNYHFELFAEFNQFYLQDDIVELDGDWILEEAENNLALNPGIIAVGTNCERVVPVDMHITCSEPRLDMQKWDMWLSAPSKSRLAGWW